MSIPHIDTVCGVEMYIWCGCICGADIYILASKHIDSIYGVEIYISGMDVYMRCRYVSSGSQCRHCLWCRYMYLVSMCMLCILYI